MIVEIFLVLTGLAVLCIVYGEVTKELSWAIVGFIIFFILSSWVLFGAFTGKDNAGLEFRSGSTITTTGNTATVNYIYKSYNDTTTFWIGLFLSVMASLGVILAAMPRGNGGK